MKNVFLMNYYKEREQVCIREVQIQYIVVRCAFVTNAVGVRWWTLSLF